MTIKWIDCTAINTTRWQHLNQMIYTDWYPHCCLAHWGRVKHTSISELDHRKNILTFVMLKFILGNCNTYWHFLPFLNLEMVQAIKILPCGNQGAVYTTLSTSWLLKTWWCNKPDHQQPWYWPCSPGILSLMVSVSIRLTMQCWPVADWTLRSTLQWTLNQNTQILPQGHACPKFLGGRFQPFYSGLNVLNDYIHQPIACHPFMVTSANVFMI